MSARQRPPRQRPGSSSPISRLQPQPEPVRVGEQVRESTTEVSNSVTTEQPESGSSVVTNFRSSDVATSEVTTSETPEVPEVEPSDVSDSDSSEVPKFRTLERKDVRVRADQLDTLSRLTRQVSAARTDRSERITENTLVRVAIDLLSEHADQLQGNTETELRKSVTTEVRNYGTPKGGQD